MSELHSSAATGYLFVVSAPSGGGKTTLVHALLDATEGLSVSVSHTTRQCRPDDQDGIDYHFVSDAKFDAMIAGGEFLEHAVVFDNRYGTSRDSVFEHLHDGRDVVLDIDWQGARMVRERFDNTVSIFILPPSVEELERRLTDRGGESTEVIARRMQDAQNEMSHYHEYDYLVFNDDFDRAVVALGNVVGAARQRRAIQQARHADILTQFVAT
ncbi:MAG: guanylate kinase [Gammaproteobacteria bacterium]